MGARKLEAKKDKELAEREAASGEHGSMERSKQPDACDFPKHCPICAVVCVCWDIGLLTAGNRADRKVGTGFSFPRR